MTTNYHTPYQDGVTQYRQSHMNAPLSELDSAITNVVTAMTVTVAFAISYQNGTLPDSDAEISIMVPFYATFPADLAGSFSYASDGPTAEATISIQKNGVEFGTLVFAIGETEGTFDGSSTSFEPGDRLSFVFDTQDATLAGVCVTLLANKYTGIESPTTTTTTTSTTTTTTTTTSSSTTTTTA